MRSTLMHKSDSEMIETSFGKNSSALQLRVSFSKHVYTAILWATIYTSVVFTRLLFVDQLFSYDYQTYLLIIDRLNWLPFSSLMNENFVFPYVLASGVVPVEIGFALFVRIVSFVNSDPVVIFAIIAALSVGLRVYVMERIGVPRIWILVLNIYAITLFEANALRLGLAVSFLLYGLYKLRDSHSLIGFIMIAVAVTFHLQTAIFLFPFLLFYFFSKQIGRSKGRLIFALSITSLFAMLLPSLFPYIDNDKINDYVARGGSESAGLSFTSVLAVIFLVTSLISIKNNDGREKDRRFWGIILAASVPAVFLLLFLTDIAVVGDRAWQLAYLVCGVFFFSNWTDKKQKKIPHSMLLILSFVMLVNITVRFPLSNFFSPLLPTIGSYAYF